MGWYRDQQHQDSFQASGQLPEASSACIAYRVGVLGGLWGRAAVCAGVLQIDVPNRTLVRY